MGQSQVATCRGNLFGVEGQGMWPDAVGMGCEKGHKRDVQLLLEKGADLESMDEEIGQTPLSLAVENGYEAIVKVLLEEGADPKRWPRRPGTGLA